MMHLHSRLHAAQVSLPGDEPWQVIHGGEGSVLLFIHGFPLDMTLWKYQLEWFAEEHHVIACNIPGFGGSRAIEQSVLSMSLLADRLVQLLDAIGLPSTTPVTPIGLSMGGYIALELWKRHPSRVARMVFCDSRVVADSEAGREHRLRVAETVEAHGVEPIVTMMIPKTVSPQTIRDQPDTVEAVKAMMRRAQPQAVAAAQRGMAARADFAEAIKSFERPFCCIVGADDEISPASEMQAIASSVTGGQCYVIPNAGHLSPLESPAAFNDALQLFLSSHPQ